MKRILYYYTSLSKQLFIIALALFFAARCGVFFISGYYKNSYLVPSILMYVAIFALCAFCFIAWKFYYTDFNPERVIFTNGILNRRREAELSKVRRANLTKRGIFLYYEGSERSDFHIPYYRFGTISPVGVESFTSLLEQKGIAIEKGYQVLPGYTKWARFLGGFYGVLALLLFINAAQYGLLFFMIMTSGK